MKIRQVGAELSLAGGRTDRHTQEDMTKPTVTFRNFAKAPIKKPLRFVSLTMLCDLYIVSDSWQGIEYDEKVRCSLKRPRFIIHTIPQSQWTD